MNKGTQAQSSDEHNEAATVINSASKNSLKNNILNSYLFKENTKKENVTPTVMGEEVSPVMRHPKKSVTVKNVGKARE